MEGSAAAGGAAHGSTAGVGVAKGIAVATAAAHRSAAAGVAARAIGAPQRRELLPHFYASASFFFRFGACGLYYDTACASILQSTYLLVSKGGAGNGVAEGMDGESRSCLAVRALFFSPAQSGAIGECLGQLASVFASLVFFCSAVVQAFNQPDVLECTTYSSVRVGPQSVGRCRPL